MFDEFDKYISVFAMENYSVDYWYDEGAGIAENMLEKFDNNDWKTLLGSIPERTVEWKKRLAYCMNDGSDLNQLTVLLKLVDTDNDELFETAVDSLRVFTGEECLNLIQTDSQIIYKVKELYPKAGDVAKRIFEVFLNKMSELSKESGRPLTQAEEEEFRIE